MADHGDVIEAAKAIDDPVFNSHEVAEKLPVGVESTRGKLSDLVDQGVIARKQVGNGWAYYFPDYD